MKLLKAKYQDPFASDTKRMLDEKRKILSWLLEEVPDLDDIVYGRSKVSNYREDTLRYYELCKMVSANTDEENNLLKQLESSDDSSEKPTLCSKLEKLMSKYATLSSQIVQLLKPEIASKGMIEFADRDTYIREVIRQHQQTADFGNQTSLVATPNTSEKDPNETVVDTSKSNPKSHLDNIEVSSKKSAVGQSQRTSKATSRASRRREAEELELENLKAKQEAEQRLREQEMQLQNEREEMKLQAEREERRLQAEREEREMEMRKRERELENERKKAEAEEERRQLEIEQKRGSSRASGSVANDMESNGSSKKQGYTKDWIQELPDPNYTPPALSPKIAVDLPKKTFPQVEKDKRLQTFSGFQKLWNKHQENQESPLWTYSGSKKLKSHR